MSRRTSGDRTSSSREEGFLTASKIYFNLTLGDHTSGFTRVIRGIHGGLSVLYGVSDLHCREEGSRDVEGSSGPRGAGDSSVEGDLTLHSREAADRPSLRRAKRAMTILTSLLILE